MFGARIVDWVDADDGKGQLGAEDFDYLALAPPYRSADRPMTTISELRLILEMNAETLRKLTPHVSALPDPAAPLNVNTATAPVLAALVPNLTAEAAEGLVSTRDSGGPWESVTDFLQEPALAGSGLSATGLGVQSGYFRVSVRARFLDRFAYLTSIVQRNPVDGSMRVFYRDMSKKISPAVTSESGDG
ncbi:MAG: type II secretion system minor pseudopilin GspK [Gammaproteobacteria bacterium]|nr:type II secretion system minor pseudopilin GspK [Gammaproteobacteria bacterium]